MAPPEEPVADPSELYGLIPEDFRQQVDPRELIARIVDGSRFHEFKENGETLVCGFARLEGFPVGILANNGVLFAESSQKGAHFIELACKRRVPLVYLQHGVHGRRRVREGRHCARRRQARYGDRVRRGAEVHRRNRWVVRRRQLREGVRARQLWMWPNARISVMGGEQAATVLTMVGDADPDEIRAKYEAEGTRTTRPRDSGTTGSSTRSTRAGCWHSGSRQRSTRRSRTEFGICERARGAGAGLRLRSGGLRGRGDPHYERAIEAGLDDEQLVKAMLGLGSSLRNVDRIDESVTVPRTPSNVPLRPGAATSSRSPCGRPAGNEALSLLARRLGEGSGYEQAIGEYGRHLRLQGLMAYTFVDVDILEGEGPGGMVRKTRRATGARAFGFNYFTLPPGTEGREHHHVDSNLEEVYFVVRGAGR